MRLPTFPAHLRAVLARLPHFPGSATFAVLLTFWLDEHLGSAALPELVGKTINIRINDMGITLAFQVVPDGFIPCSINRADLTFAAAAQDFLDLALRREDPDTLFFSRRLIMEGDTELGLLIKNKLDALDTATLRIRFPPPATAFRLLGLALRNR